MGTLPKLQHREPNHPRGTRPWAHMFFVPLCVHASQPRAAEGLQCAPCSAYDCREPGESASTWAVPTFWGFLATWKSLNVLCCTAKLISCLWATCPQMGKVLVSSSSPARAVLQLCWARVIDAAAKPKRAVQWVAHTQNVEVYPGFSILWHIPNSTFNYAE